MTRRVTAPTVRRRKAVSSSWRYAGHAHEKRAATSGARVPRLLSSAGTFRGFDSLRLHFPPLRAAFRR
jgi:hypothetical protein